MKTNKPDREYKKDDPKRYKTRAKKGRRQVREAKRTYE